MNKNFCPKEDETSGFEPDTWTFWGSFYFALTVFTTIGKDNFKWFRALGQLAGSLVATKRLCLRLRLLVDPSVHAPIPVSPP